MLVMLGVKLQSLAHARQVIYHWAISSSLQLITSGNPQLCLSLTGRQVTDEMGGGCTQHRLWILAAQSLKSRLPLTSYVAARHFSEKEETLLTNLLMLGTWFMPEFRVCVTVFFVMFLR